MHKNFDNNDINSKQGQTNNNINEISKIEIDSLFFENMSPMEILNKDYILKPTIINDSINFHNFKCNDMTKTAFGKLIEEADLENNNYFINKENNDSIHIFQEFKNIDKKQAKELKCNKLRKKRGRKGKDGDHNKFTCDNLIRKCKHLVLKSVLNFINNKIKDIYKNNIGYGILLKQLLIINQKQKSDASIDYNKQFLNKSLSDIFSENITTRYTNYPLNHNKDLIQFLRTDENGNSEYFKRLFNLIFMDCLNHFRGSKKIEELEGIIGIESLENEYNNDPDYLISLKYYFKNYENILNNKRARDKKKSKDINK